MTINLKWSPRVIGDSQKVYRSESPFDADSLPTALATIGASDVEYEDLTDVLGAVYYYAIETVYGTQTALSAIVEVALASGSAAVPWDLSVYDFDGNTAILVDDFQAGHYYSGGYVAFVDINNLTRTDAGTYVDSSGAIATAVADEERIDFGPISLVKTGLLIEASSTNKQHNSESVVAAGEENVTTIDDVYASPDDTANAGTIIETTANANHSLALGNIAMSAGTKVMSAYVKPDGRDYVTLTMVDSINNYVAATFDLTDGSVTQTKAIGSANAHAASGAKLMKNGFYRCWMKAFYDVPSGTLQPVISLSDSATFTHDAYGRKIYSGDSAKGIAVFGMQAEERGDLTSYTKTTTADVSRGADSVYTQAGSLPFTDYNQTKVSGKIIITPLGYGLLNYVSFNDGTSNNVIEIYQDSSQNIKMKVTVGGVVQADIDSLVNSDFDVEAVISFRAGANDFGISVDGSAEQTDSAGSMPTVTRSDLGEDCILGSIICYDALITDLAGLSA